MRDNYFYWGITNPIPHFPFVFRFISTLSKCMVVLLVPFDRINGEPLYCSHGSVVAVKGVGQHEIFFVWASGIQFGRDY